MYCKHCANLMDEQAAVCVKCGCPKGSGNSYCPNCGNATMEQAAFCVNCGAALSQQAQPAASGELKSKMAAGLLGIFLGAWGIHNFYLGYTGKAVAQLILTLVSCGIGGIWGFIEGILILTGSINKDGKGNPLRD